MGPRSWSVRKKRALRGLGVELWTAEQDRSLRFGSCGGGMALGSMPFGCGAGRAGYLLGEAGSVACKRFAWQGLSQWHHPLARIALFIWQARVGETNRQMSDATGESASCGREQQADPAVMSAVPRGCGRRDGRSVFVLRGEKLDGEALSRRACGDNAVRDRGRRAKPSQARKPRPPGRNLVDTPTATLNRNLALSGAARCTRHPGILVRNQRSQPSVKHKGASLQDPGNFAAGEERATPERAIFSKP